jgi:hypothetical protein
VVKSHVNLVDTIRRGSELGGHPRSGRDRVKL